jgi:hypothetical protein
VWRRGSPRAPTWATHEMREDYSCPLLSLRPNNQDLCQVDLHLREMDLVLKRRHAHMIWRRGRGRGEAN